MKIEEIKTLMLSEPVVRLPDVEKDFILETDGIKVAAEQCESSGSTTPASNTRSASSAEL